MSGPAVAGKRRTPAKTRGSSGASKPTRKLRAPRVSVYITNHNYGRYLEQAIQSVLNQTLRDFELIIVDDGSTDDSREIISRYAGRERVRAVFQERRGLNASNNVALRQARGRYFIRLDADDYLDENALLVLSGVLDANSDVALVYPDYFLVSGDGEVLGHVRREKIGDDLSLLDLPAHGAGTMVRTDCLLAVQGYDEAVDCQDGYDLWLKFIDRYKVRNVSLPLFYYRRHPVSLTTNQAKILRARRMLKDRHAQRRYGSTPPAVAIIPVRNRSPLGEGWALRPLGGKPVLQHTLDEVRRCPLLTRAVVVTEDRAIAEYAAGQGAEVLRRPAELARMNSPIEPTIRYCLEQLAGGGFSPEIVCLLHASSPLRRAEHISEAIQTLLIFQPDSVISVCENTRLQYQHRLNGLEPVFRRRELRLEREVLYEENGAIYVSWRRAISERSFLGSRVGHIIMTRESSVDLDQPYEFWLAEGLVGMRGTPLAESWDL